MRARRYRLHAEMSHPAMRRRYRLYHMAGCGNQASNVQKDCLQVKESETHIDFGWESGVLNGRPVSASPSNSAPLLFSVT